MFTPPEMISSALRPVRNTKPSSSTYPISPSVKKLPLCTLAVFAGSLWYSNGSTSDRLNHTVPTSPGAATSPSPTRISTVASGVARPTLPGRRSQSFDVMYVPPPSVAA